MTAALEIEGLSVSFPTRDRWVSVVREVSLCVDEGEIAGLVGESGSGKSLTAMSALGLLPAGARMQCERLRLDGESVDGRTGREMEALRGSRIALVPQEPMNSLNPTMRIGRQLELVVRSNRRVSSAQARDIAVEYLERMLITDAARVMTAHPFELSGGMRQRVLLAMAFSCNPRVLIADEPTTALDVTVQQEVLTLLRESAAATDTAVLFISHDLAVVSQLCDTVAVMRAGEIVERGETSDVIGRPMHPYTRALLASLPANSPPGSRLPIGEGGAAADSGGPA